LTEQAVAVAEGIGTVWIDKVENACAPGDAAMGGGALAELADMVDATASNPAILAAIEAEAARVIQALPKELREMLGPDQAAIAARMAALLHDGSAEILAQLAGAGEG
jgi:hypothetical protein